MNFFKNIRLYGCLLAVFTLLLVLQAFVPKPKNKQVKFVVPKGWKKPLYNFNKNPLTAAGVELGRYLFYDGLLSKDGYTPCASCHQQEAAFANYDHPLSHGYNNQFTTRNAPALQNLAWSRLYMQDGSINQLDSQPIHPLTASNEMAETIKNIQLKLNQNASYKMMFKNTFNVNTITINEVVKALSQFVVSLVSSNSKYDKVMRGEDQFILPERLGHEIFTTKCASCHPPPFFTDFSYRNIGIEIDSRLKDVGRMKVTKLPSDSLKFRVPSLRNVELTKPYGHDGRFYDVYNVLDHYRSAVLPSATTDTLLLPILSLSEFEIGQLTAFLNTLTDTSFIHDKRFSNPFTKNLSLHHNH